MPRRTGPRDTGDNRPTRRTGGRPPIVADPDRVTRMLEAISAGVPIGQACLHAGISERAHFRAMAAGEAADEHAEAAREARARGEQPPDEPDGRQTAYRQYRQDVLRARAAVAVVHVALVGKAARGGALVRETTRRSVDENGKPVVEVDREYARGEWKASQFLLATSFREEFGPPTRRQVEHSGPAGGPIEHAGPGEAALLTLSERLQRVAELQRDQLPGGWDRPALEAGPDHDVADAVIVDDTADGTR